ncbi:MAG: flagellar export protein FliJ [Bdellovibrionales bacterium]
MAKLSGLIKVQKHRVDEKQKILARLYREQEELEQKKQELLEQIEKETQIANQMDDDPITRLSFANFVDNTKTKIAKLDDDIDKVKMRVELAQDKIREAFEELKKTEIVERNRKTEEKKKIAKKVSQELDEIGIEGCRRKNSD